MKRIAYVLADLQREEKHPARSIYRVAGQVAELADALDLESSGATRQSSSLCLPTCCAPPTGKAGGVTQEVDAEVAQW